MASINSLSTTNPTTLQVLPPVGGTEPTTTTTNTAPAFQETLTTQNRAFALGLGGPRNHGDIEALFGEIAAQFGKEVAQATDYAEAAEDAKRSTALRAAAGNLALFAGLSALITAEQQNIAKQERHIADLEVQIDSLTTQKDGLVEQRDALQAEWNANAARVIEAGLEVGGLGLELGAVLLAKETACGFDPGSSDCANLTADVNSLNDQIDALSDEIDTLTARNDVLTPQIFALTGQIIQLEFQILGLEAEKGLAELAMEFSEAAIDLFSGILEAFAVLVMPFSVELALSVTRERSRASFEMLPEQLGLDKSITDAANNVAEQVTRMGTIDAARKALEASRTSDPTTSPVDGEPGGTGGATLGAGSDLGKIAEAALALLGQMRQLMEKGVAPEDSTRTATGNPGAMDLIRQSLDQSLPPDSGDRELATGRAAGLAGALSLLQDILTKVGSGESSLNTQMPGPSGRLTLAI